MLNLSSIAFHHKSVIVTKRRLMEILVRRNDLVKELHLVQGIVERNGLEPGDRMMWFLMQEEANQMFHGPPDDVDYELPDPY